MVHGTILCSPSFLRLLRTVGVEGCVKRRATLTAVSRSMVDESPHAWNLFRTRRLRRERTWESGVCGAGGLEGDVATLAGELRYGSTGGPDRCYWGNLGEQIDGSGAVLRRHPSSKQEGGRSPSDRPPDFGTGAAPDNAPGPRGNWSRPTGGASAPPALLGSDAMFTGRTPWPDESLGSQSEGSGAA